jgi:glutamine amidotransferase
MSSKRVVVIDHGIGNIRSVTNAIDFLGFEAILASSPEPVTDGEIVILPGVGNFGGVMGAIESRGLFEAIDEYIKLGRPLIGICVGLQVLFESSTESPNSKGFGLFTGSLRHLNTLETNQVTPSIGWQKLVYKDETSPSVRLGEAYFVHNYFADGLDDSALLATYDWNGHQIPAHVGVGNVHGVQFHPEKSRMDGVRFLGGLIEELSR